MASGRLVFAGRMPALDPDGVPYPDARIFFFVNRTTTLAVVYADEALTTPLANPVLADASGNFVPVWADQDLLFSASLESIALGQIDTVDDLEPSASVATVTNKLNRDGSNPDADILTNLPFVAEAGVSRPASEKLEEVSLSVLDHGSANSAAIYAAQAVGQEKSRPITLPGGVNGSPANYVLSSPIGQQTTWLVDGPITYSGAAAAIGLPGKGVWFGGTGVGGGAAGDPMYVGPMPDATGSFWVQDQYSAITGRGNTLGATTLAGVSYFGNSGVLGASRTSDNTAAAGSYSTYGGFFFAINDDTTVKKTGSGVYVEGIRKSGAGSTLGAEIDVINYGNTIALSPVDTYLDEQTVGLLIASGGEGLGGVTDISAGMVMHYNGARAKTGLIIQDNFLVRDGGGFGEAIALGYKSILSQYVSAGAGGGQGSRIIFGVDNAAAGSQMLFLDGEWSVRGIAGGEVWVSATATGATLPSTTYLGGVAGAEALRVLPTPSAVNRVEAFGSVSGAIPGVRANGPASDIDFAVLAKGDGRLLLGPTTSSADAAIVGYMSVKNSSGVAVKLAIIA